MFLVLERVRARGRIPGAVWSRGGPPLSQSPGCAPTNAAMDLLDISAPTSHCWFCLVHCLPRPPASLCRAGPQLASLQRDGQSQLQDFTFALVGFHDWLTPLGSLGASEWKLYPQFVDSTSHLLLQVTDKYIKRDMTQDRPLQHCTRNWPPGRVQSLNFSLSIQLFFSPIW